MEKNIRSLVCGFLFNPSFKILDYWGSIADGILYNNNYFPEHFFPNISSQYTTDRAVFNYETKNSIRLTSSNLIYTQYIRESYSKEYKEFCTRVKCHLVPEILCKYNLVVRRIGLVCCTALEESEIEKFASIYFKSNVPAITDFRFSIKKSTSEGALWSDKNDYINKIFTVGDVDKDSKGEPVKGISYDFQHYYVPAQADVRDKVDPFFQQFQENFTKDVLDNIGD